MRRDAKMDASSLADETKPVHGVLRVAEAVGPNAIRQRRKVRQPVGRLERGRHVQEVLGDADLVLVSLLDGLVVQLLRMTAQMPCAGLSVASCPVRAHAMVRSSTNARCRRLGAASAKSSMIREALALDQGSLSSLISSSSESESMSESKWNMS